MDFHDFLPGDFGCNEESGEWNRAFSRSSAATGSLRWRLSVGLGESEPRSGRAAASGGAVEGGFRGDAGVFGAPAVVEQLIDGENLDAGIVAVGEVLGEIQASGGGFGFHGTGGRLEGDKEAEPVKLAGQAPLRNRMPPA